MADRRVRVNIDTDEESFKAGMASVQAHTGRFTVALRQGQRRWRSWWRRWL